MKLKQYVRYQMDFKGKWVGASAFAMGAFVFFRMVYYFGLVNLSDCGFGEILFRLILPLLLGVGYVVLMSVMRWNAPGIYGILAAALCLLLIVGSFYTGSFLRILLSLILYFVAGVLLLGTTTGYVPDKLPAVVLLGGCILGRILLFDLGELRVLPFFLEVSTLSMMVSLLLLPFCLKRVKSRQSAQ